QKLRVIALISGGKDSLFSILHCLANGHDVVALANLYPSAEQNEEDEDINSYMYQTVGHSIIPLYSEVLGIPLYREPIVGSAANDSREYAPNEAQKSKTLGSGEVDETESLIPLLERIKNAHPNANAISTGAILSTYQRTRIESVAIRLGLIPLSFLWQYPYLPPYQQSSLLQDMRAVGQDARIIKVASGGLDEGFLWQNVADNKVIRRLKRRMGQFGGAGGGAILGEGGEFETLAVFGPSPLWKGRIEVADVTTVPGEGGSALVRLASAKAVMDVVPTEPGDVEGRDTSSKLRIPPLFDDEFIQVFQRLEALPPNDLRRTPTESMNGDNAQELIGQLAQLNSVSIDSSSDHIDRGKSLTQVVNIMGEGLSTADQMANILTKIERVLVQLSVTAASIVASTLLLRSMDDFATINFIYGKLFTEPIPPSRITISCGDSLPPAVYVVLSVVIDRGVTTRLNGLHVQSRSYWAPANIGPYSQAISVPIKSATDYEGLTNTDLATSSPKTVYVAGQIPLVPSTMNIVCIEDVMNAGDCQHSIQDTGFMVQTTLALQHLWRIGRVMDVTWWAGSIAFISNTTRQQGERLAQIIGEAWRSAHNIGGDGAESAGSDEEGNQEADGLDAWDLKYRRHLRNDIEEKDARPQLPDYSQLENSKPFDRHEVPPCFVVQVDALPRGADIEWTAPGLAGCKVQQNVGVSEPESSYITTIRNEGFDY
ncbi:adenine nucleotide alpha hydrolases-like protein, partial [Tothia fuscella]